MLESESKEWQSGPITVFKFGVIFIASVACAFFSFRVQTWENQLHWIEATSNPFVWLELVKLVRSKSGTETGPSSSQQKRENWRGGSEISWSDKQLKIRDFFSEAYWVEVHLRALKCVTESVKPNLPFSRAISHKVGTRESFTPIFCNISNLS